MKTQNMKLLDLQTGKYLKLGKDFYYGGDSIYLIERLEQCLKSHNKWLVSLISIALKCIHSSNQRNISYELAQKVVDNQEITEDIVANSQSQSGVITKSETPVIHGNECVYGGRYVLIKEIDVWVYNNDLPPKYIKTGDIILYRPWSGYDKKILININDFYTQVNDNHHKNTFYLKEARLDDYSFFQIQSILGNIFEEYSKQLRNEPNKFDELNQHLI